MDASPRAMASAVLTDWNFAVLNDWDLASDASPLSATDTCLPSHATGSHLPSQIAELLPSPPSVTFAAIDILHDAFTGVVGHLYRLRDLEHLYRHDLEAFVWVFIWVACCIEDGTSSRCVEDARRLDPLPELFNDWVLGDVKRCQGSKFRILHFGFNAVGPTSTWATGPPSTWAAGPPSIAWAAEGSLANSLLFYLFRLHNRQAEVVWDVTENAAPPEEEDAPEKDWKEFSQVFRRAGQRNPALDYLVDLVVE